MLVSLFLFATLAPSGGGHIPIVYLEVETLMAPSIGELATGKVTAKQELTLTSGNKFQYDYTDPNNGHFY